MRPKLLIVDGHNFLWKAYGVPFKFHSTKGMPLHVVTAFLALLRRALIAADPAGACAVAVVFDTDTVLSNHLLSKDYKANRKTDFSEDEDSPFRHLPQIRRTLTHLGIKTFERKGREADDVIASLATQFLAAHQSGKVFIASSDSDFYQLLGPRISQIILGKKGTHVLMTPKELAARFGVLPRWYVYFKSLTGDTADNVKGIPGVGPIRARWIIAKKLKIDLRPYAKLLALNQKLVELDRSLKISRDPLKLLPREKILSAKSREIFKALDF